MTNIIKFPVSRALRRRSGEIYEVRKLIRHNVSLRVLLPRQDRAYVEDLLYGHMFRLLQKLGGFRLTNGFKLRVVRSGEWHELPFVVHPWLLKKFLRAVDTYCERGWLEVNVDGALMARSLRA